MTSHRIKVNIDGQEFDTFEDILPPNSVFKILFVGKVPAPDSVSAGHYFYKNATFWNRLKEHGILNVPYGQNEDDYLVEHGFGITDIVKKPREYGIEPSTAEYQKGIERFFDLLKTIRPKIIVFIYKGALDKILKIKFGLKPKSQSSSEHKSNYGFNPQFDRLFNSKVFVFPMPGTPCRREQAKLHMKELSIFVNHFIDKI